MDSFRNLNIWKQSCELIVMVYKLIDKFPTSERYGLSSQLGRSVNSVGANIAESCGRFHYKDKTNFLYHSRGSLIETEHNLYIADKLGYISDKQLDSVLAVTKDLGVRLNNYIKSIKSN